MRFLFAVFLWSLAGTCLTFAKERPNFIFILTDDQSYGMMGCDGNDVTQTPNLDRLASDGVFFDRAYITSAICTPSRVSIFLSQFERRHGVNFNSGTSVAPEAWAKSYPVLMRQAGYYTGYVGKNHAPIGKGGYDSGLMEQCFDYFYAEHGHLRFYPKDHHEVFRSAVSDTQVEVLSEGIEDFLSTEHRLEGVLRFLALRPSDQPFCLSVCLNLPHGAGTSTMQMRASDDDTYKTLYRDEKVPLPKGYTAKAEIKVPKLPPEILKVENRQTGYDWVDTPSTARERITRQMQAMTGIDRMLGRIQTKLDDEGLNHNTVIIFTSDHGLFSGQQGLGGKALCYEQTTHVPLIVYDPTSSSTERGRRCGELVQSIDLAPTMLDLAGIDRPASFQGKSLRELIQRGDKPVHDYIFTENLWSTHFGNPRIEAVQDKRWKYIRYYKNENFPASKKIKTARELGLPVNHFLYGVHDDSIPVYRYFVEASLEGEPAVYEELYDLQNDPGEFQNLIRESLHGRILEHLREAWNLKLIEARGTGPPKVLRYTSESRNESRLK